MGNLIAVEKDRAGLRQAGNKLARACSLAIIVDQPQVARTVSSGRFCLSMPLKEGPYPR